MAFTIQNNNLLNNDWKKSYFVAQSTCELYEHFSKLSQSKVVDTLVEGTQNYSAGLQNFAFFDKLRWG